MSNLTEAMIRENQKFSKEKEKKQKIKESKKIVKEVVTFNKAMQAYLDAASCLHSNEARDAFEAEKWGVEIENVLMDYEDRLADGLPEDRDATVADYAKYLPPEAQDKIVKIYQKKFGKTESKKKVKESLDAQGISDLIQEFSQRKITITDLKHVIRDWELEYNSRYMNAIDRGSSPDAARDEARQGSGFYESKNREKVKVKEAYLGLDLGKFSPFSKYDWYGYAGASPIDNDEPLIYHGDQFDILISGEADAPSSSALDRVYIEVDIFVDEESGQTVVGTKGPMSLQRAIRSANRLVAFDTESLSVNDIIEELEESGFNIQII